VNPLHDLLRQAVVEILVHLVDEFLVVQRGKIENLSVFRHFRVVPCSPEPSE